jgi:hypothetical protein
MYALLFGVRIAISSSSCLKTPNLFCLSNMSSKYVYESTEIAKTGVNQQIYYHLRQICIFIVNFDLVSWSLAAAVP